jgi:outer membrane receptor protein involved in Fe transport
VVNFGVSRDFTWSPEFKPVTLRFDIINLFDNPYELRDGSGIGVFAPQCGARRGFYAGISQKLSGIAQKVWSGHVAPSTPS